MPKHEIFKVAGRARKQRQMRRAAGKAAEAGVETQTARIGVTMRGTDKADARIALVCLREEVFNQQQVVEFERQCGAAHGDDLFFQGVILLVLCGALAPLMRGALRTLAAPDCSEQRQASQGQIAIFLRSVSGCGGAAARLRGHEDFLSERFILYSMRRLNCDDTVDLSNPAPARRR